VSVSYLEYMGNLVLKCPDTYQLPAMGQNEALLVSGSGQTLNRAPRLVEEQRRKGLGWMMVAKTYLYCTLVALTDADLALNLVYYGSPPVDRDTRDRFWLSAPAGSNTRWQLHRRVRPTGISGGG
jgi:hypothetical protein